MYQTKVFPLLSVILLPISLTYHQVYAQYQALKPQTDTFNSSATITPAQQRSAGINATLANNLAVSLNFERSNFAHGPGSSDSFYHVPLGSAAAAPGTLLKLQVDANTTAYTLPPNTALSRFIFQSESINGSKVPVSAYILWPYLPRTETDGLPVVAWAHGTSGLFGNCAPSNYRNLLYQFATIFELALQGYVVVAPDYLGLGVSKDAQGKPLTHPYFGTPSHANDLFYSVQAARTAFPSLSKRFVVMGHSQGGGAAWAAAVRQAQKPVKGYLGAVVGSPVTDFIGLVKTTGSATVAAFIARTLTTLYPSVVKLSDILTPAGIGRLALTAEIQGCLSTATELFADQNLTQPNWTDNHYVQVYNNLTDPGGKPIAGPVLVLQGDSDASVPFPVVTDSVHETCTKHPDSRLHYATFAGAAHVPTMFASQRLWLDFIAARFAGTTVGKGCRTSNYTSARPYRYYQKEQSWFVEYAVDAYETA
ncbi:MAG: hypothetical protein HETSPECPRED_003226 [Heterodermia speciosa]|uniref:Serine aminopeptidase S33 domain-containing protein n=1 Tax=Heterodermia speciosa TaxID=116794 RepID=A0A8H3J691_9LECA|nr:MAG: hypothetical protein HETSPECPRED_003226 [Heterodermia speciosa]